MSPIQGELVELRIDPKGFCAPQLKLSKEEFHATRACRRFKVDLLNYELTQMASARRNFQRWYESVRSSLKTSLSPLDFNHVCSVIETRQIFLVEIATQKLALGCLKFHFPVANLCGIIEGYKILFSVTNTILDKVAM